MKKIINGVKYDTETAELMGSHGYSNPRDFRYFIESLFMTKSGRLFLHGEGGPASIYGKQTGQNSWGGSETIIPMSYAEAQKWVEENLSGDDYERIFGEVDEDDSKKLIPLMINSDLAEKLARYADQTGKKQGEVVEQLLMTLDA